MTTSADPSSGAAGDVVELARSIGAALEQSAARAKLLGGVAVALRCPSARPPSPLSRAYSDIDYATARKSKRALQTVLVDHGFAPVSRFNAANGHVRLLFEAESGMHADVFVDKFEMCHTLRLSDRLGEPEPTLPLADLLLTKLQVAEVNAKDIIDVVALLHDHELTDDESGINVDYLAGLLARDWGWWRTVSANLDVVEAQIERLGLGAPFEARARGVLGELVARINDRRKTARWKARSLIGERMSWRQAPEEPVRGQIAAQQ